MEGILSTLARLQFGQALARLASSPSYPEALYVVAIALITWLLGRWFCSFVCPLGALMDLAGRLKGLFSRTKFTHQPQTYKRFLIPTLALLAFWFGATTLFGLLEPYSLLVAKSLLYAGPNLILVGVIILAAFKGRVFCDYLCPTGLSLKILASRSLLRLTIRDSCLSCGACSRVCPTSCVDGRAKALEPGRCVLCLDCLAVCPNGSLTYGFESIKLEPKRRAFLSQAALGLVVASSSLAPASLRAKAYGQPEAVPVLPPGALSLAHLGAHCSLCHSCVRICPNHALVPSSNAHPALWNRPVLDAYVGFCQYDCVLCGQICPTKALIPLTVEEKRVARVGTVFFERPECVIVRNNTSCGACAELCPTGAVSMIMAPSGREEPTIQDNLCIGCGACQQACPVRPISAIRVNGLLIQQTAARPEKIATEDETLTEDFPF
ncbi:MAG: 4Fe-4S binding protein [Deltaproteobacteria bacterium]|nr:4Fe-4S binding protein [Deltaproteobacteria bacterium]